MKTCSSSSSLVALLGLLLGSERTFAQQQQQQIERNLIQDGNNANRKEYPYFAQGAGCGASLVWKDILLTAAHCEGLFDKVLVGARRSNTRDRYNQLMSGQQEIPHPDYDGGIFKDYMIVVLDKEVTNHHIETVGLAGEDLPPLQAGDDLTAIGFGDTKQHIDGIQWSGILQEVELSYVDDQECANVYGQEPAFDERYMFCARSADYYSKGDTCRGDSGGPLLNQEGYQVGITSWGHSDGCGFRHFPGVYSTVPSEIEWIKQSICEYASNPPAWACEGGTSSVPPSKIPFNFLNWLKQKSWSLIAQYAVGGFLVLAGLYIGYKDCRRSNNKNGRNEKGDDDETATGSNLDDAEFGTSGKDTMPDVE